MHEAKLQAVRRNVRRFKDEVDGMTGARASFAAVAPSPPTRPRACPPLLSERG